MRFKSILIPAFVVFVAGAGSAMCKANNIYTFDTQFTLGEYTPIGPVAPDIGSPSFMTTFSATGDPGGAAVEAGFPSSLFSGQFLVTGVPGPLTLTFNQPVYSLSVAFGLDAPVYDPEAYFELVTPTATYDQPNQAAGGGPYADGVLTYSSTTPFTTATLDAFAVPGSETLFAIDNLDLTTTSPVPEPSYLPLLGAALAGLVVVSRRLNWRAASSTPLN